METILQTVWTNYMLENDCWDKTMSADKQISAVLSEIDLGNYTSQSQGLLVIMIALSPEAFERKECLIYRRKTQEIEIYINMDYQTLLEADEKETLHLISKTYLLAIKRFLSKRKDFDHKRFYADVREIFEKNKLLPNPIFSKKSLRKIKEKFWYKRK